MRRLYRVPAAATRRPCAPPALDPDALPGVGWVTLHIEAPRCEHLRVP